ncbi:chemotaxis protein CheX [Reichenbachiella versicolor]|uniref:chemotaxis protein CheX n=1 Tax=Reichenbachiella versicolor TaxID=1821036 RepID=UPI000D6DED4F|nr:chemotaxis protein CheX [Reichenbachiella versicolor]
MDTKQLEFEKTVNVFINSIEKYFNKLTDTPIQTHPPFIKQPDDLVLKECTGMIGISGSKMGLVYISGGMELFRDLILQYVGLEKPTTSDMLDMAGELSNVVAGNVRESYGREFMISIPIVFQGSPDKLKFPKDVPIYVIPFDWDGHEAYMVIGLK